MAEKPVAYKIVVPDRASGVLAAASRSRMRLKRRPLWRLNRRRRHLGSVRLG